MPNFYDTHISPQGMCRDDAFGCLARARALRLEAIAGSVPRAFAISQARFLIHNAALRDKSARRLGFSLA